MMRCQWVYGPVRMEEFHGYDPFFFFLFSPLFYLLFRDMGYLIVCLGNLNYYSSLLLSLN